MKPNHLASLALGLFLSIGHAAAASTDATPLPEFKTDKQLAQWRAEKASAAATAESLAIQQDATAFYTGKPYLSHTGGYAFKFRNYNPQLARWTSEDPSGFPDGANQSVYAPVPTSGLDYEGLTMLMFTGCSTISVYTGSGKKDKDGIIDFGDPTGQSWNACSGGAGGKPPIENGMWTIGARIANLGGPADVANGGERSERDWQTSVTTTVNGKPVITTTWNQGSMSAWANGYNGGPNHDGTTFTQYKYAITPNDGQNGAGIKLHPDGPVIGVTHGCVGISGFTEATSIDAFLSTHAGMKFYVSHE